MTDKKLKSFEEIEKIIATHYYNDFIEVIADEIDFNQEVLDELINRHLNKFSIRQIVIIVNNEYREPYKTFILSKLVNSKWIQLKNYIFRKYYKNIDQSENKILYSYINDNKD